MSSRPPWHPAHVHYHARDRSGLLLDAVEPLIAQVRDDVAGLYVVPHWQRGPHLRLMFAAEPAVWAGRVRPAVERIVGGYLRQKPSTARIDVEAALAQHRRLAELEKLDGPLTPWAPDNTIEFPPFQSRVEAMGGAEIADLVTDFYVASNDHYLAATRYLRDGAEPVDLFGLTLLLITAGTDGGLRRNVGSFRSHAEGFLSRCADPQAARAVFEREFARHRETILTRVRDVADPAYTPPPLMQAWAALMRWVRGRAEPAVRSGALRFPDELRQSDIEDPRTPEYLRRAFANEAYVRRGLDNPDFLRYRVVLNCSYLQLTRLGVAPPNRHLLCHLAANAIEELYGVSAIGAIERFVAEHP